MRLLLLTAFIFIGINANAQDSTLIQDSTIIQDSTAIQLISIKNARTSIGFTLSPNFSSIRYVDNGNLPDGYIDELKSGTTGTLGFSASFFFLNELTDKLFVQWGLGAQNYRYRTSYYNQVQLEHPTINRETTYNQYYLQIGASLKYRVYRTLYARAGIGVDILMEQRAERTESCPTCDYYYKGEDYGSRFKEVLVPVNFGLGYEMKLNDRLNLVTELFGTMSLTRAYEGLTFSDQVGVLEYNPITNVHLQQKPLQIGFSIGIIRSF